MRLAILFAFLALLASCARVCKPKTMHCIGSKVQLCDPNGRWRDVMDCKAVGGKDQTWRCCCLGEKDGRCSCRPGEK